MKPNLREIGSHFEIEAEFISAIPWGSGHINDTYLATYACAGQEIKLIHQRINDFVFKRPCEIMENIHLITEHLNQRAISNNQEESQLTFNLTFTRDGKSFFIDHEGKYWRTFQFIDNTQSYDIIETPHQAYEAAKMFGRFQAQLNDFPTSRLFETIPDFHNTPKRFQALQTAIRQDVWHRVHHCQKEIAFFLERESLTDQLLQLHEAGKIPLRVTHNDTKLNNVLLDIDTEKGMCVIDLDTVMPGLALYDFGDMVRTFTSPASEDEQDLSKVTMQLSMFEALLEGFLTETYSILTPTEIDHLVFSGKLITLEIGMRFLTDFLDGDVYFHTHRNHHNLDRCRTQIQLVKSIEAQESQMEALVSKVFARFEN